MKLQVSVAWHSMMQKHAFIKHEPIQILRCPSLHTKKGLCWLAFAARGLIKLATTSAVRNGNTTRDSLCDRRLQCCVHVCTSSLATHALKTSCGNRPSKVFNHQVKFRDGHHDHHCAHHRGLAACGGLQAPLSQQPGR